MLRQFIAAEFKHGRRDDYPDQVQTLTEIVDKWIKDGDYNSIPDSIKVYFGTWLGEGIIRNTEHIAWKQLLSNNAAAKRGGNNAKQQEYAVNLRNRLWVLCKHVKQAAELKYRPLDPKNIDGYSQIMNSLNVFDKVCKELWPDHGLIPPPKLDGEKYTIDMGVDEPLSARARVAAIEERISSHNNGQRRLSLRRRSGESKTSKLDKLAKLKKQIRTFIKEFKKLLNHQLAPAESKFIPAEGLKMDGSETYYELEPTDEGGSRKKTTAFSGPSKGFEALKPYAEKLLNKLSPEDKKDMIIFGWYWALGKKKEPKNIRFIMKTEN